MRERLENIAFNPNGPTLRKFIEARRPKEETLVSSSPAEEIAARVKGKLRSVTGTPEDVEMSPEKVEELIETAARKRWRIDETPEDAKRRVLHKLPFLLQPEDRPGAPFYRIEMHSSQTFIFLNTRHPFYEKVYVPLEKIGGNALTGIQLLLFTLAQGEAQVGLAVKKWYEDEIQKWSGMLTTFLRELPEQKNLHTLPEDLQEDI